MSIIIRLAIDEDCQIILKWRNHKVVRDASLDKKKISQREHLIWFKKMCSSNNNLLCIAQYAGVDMGVIIFRINHKKKAEISIYLAPDYIGKGYGEKVLREGINFFKEKFPNVRNITATVLEGNIASIKMFEKYGFIRKNVEMELFL